MNPPRAISSLFALLTLFAISARAADSWPEIPRRLPPVGIKLADADRQQIEAALARLDASMAKFAQLSDQFDLQADVGVYSKAVHFALRYEEFYKPADVKKALDLLAAAQKRADELATGKHSWTQQHGAFVRGYRSFIDGSLQPYGLEIPADLDLSKPAPLYVWLHGRGDTSTDMHFIAERTGRRGQIAPAAAIVLHAFGRQCIGFKSAGEVDIFEAIDSVKHRYAIDPDRILLMGFSMGGAGAWHVGAHYATEFAAVHAGAGFIDVAKYQKLTPDKYPAWYEQTLWGLYDVPDYVRNLFNTTMVAYGGEIDPQRASAVLMSEAFKVEGRDLTFITGPKMPHKYDPDSLAQIMRLMQAAQEKGVDRYEPSVSLQTRTLRYNRMRWATIDALHQHWDDSRLDAAVAGDHAIAVKTKNVEGFTLSAPWPDLAAGRSIDIDVDGVVVPVPSLRLRDRGAHFMKTGNTWIDAGLAGPKAGELHKRHGLQGPIDDAFMDAFLVVVPGEKCADPRVQKWVEFELNHFQERWPEVFRGDLRVKRDSEVTAEDIHRYNLVMWGDPKANRMIARVADGLPVRWVGGSLQVGQKKFDAATHVPLLIYPNPLNPAKYVVLNSGPTFRENDDRTNSLQNPKLPDWAIVDATTQPDAKSPGKVEDAAFFDEAWQMTEKRP